MEVEQLRYQLVYTSSGEMCREDHNLKVSAHSSSDDVEDEGACEGEVNVHEARKVL